MDKMRAPSFLGLGRSFQTLHFSLLYVLDALPSYPEFHYGLFEVKPCRVSFYP